MADHDERAAAAGERRADETSLAVILFEDIQASTALKRSVTKRADEAAFQELRREHDRLVAGIITRGGAGEVTKWTGDGLIAMFRAPSVAVERAIEIQDAMHAHPQLKVRIGIDMGEVQVERQDGKQTDVYGAHVDRAARAMSLVGGGHIGVTAAVHADAFAWITKSRIAWKRHGPHRYKPGDSPIDVYQPYNANRQRPMRRLHGEKVVEEVPAEKRAAKAPPKDTPVAVPVAGESEGLTLVRPWEAVARDGREFAESGGGTMYWFKVPLGGLSYPEGFRHFLQPALENPGISKVRFILDRSNETVREIWDGIVLPLAREWAASTDCMVRLEQRDPDSGSLVLESKGDKAMSWIFVDLSAEFTPCFKLFVDDPDTPEVSEQQAQIFLSTANRVVRLEDGSHRSIRIPDAVLRVRPGRHEALLNALNAVANQWDSLF